MSARGLRRNISKAGARFQRTINRNSIWRIKWSRGQWLHMILKGQVMTPICLGPLSQQQLEILACLQCSFCAPVNCIIDRSKTAAIKKWLQYAAKLLLSLFSIYAVFDVSCHYLAWLYVFCIYAVQKGKWRSQNEPKLLSFLGSKYAKIAFEAEAPSRTLLWELTAGFKGVALRQWWERWFFLKSACGFILVFYSASLYMCDVYFVVFCHLLL